MGWLAEALPGNEQRVCNCCRLCLGVLLVVPTRMQTSLPRSPHQGEGEAEETDDLVSQVLDEIGINLNSQVRGGGVMGPADGQEWELAAACSSKSPAHGRRKHQAHVPAPNTLSLSLLRPQMANVPDMPVAAPAASAPMAAMAEGLGGGGGGGGAGPSGGAGGGPSGGMGAGGGSGIDEDLQARLDNLRKS